MGKIIIRVISAIIGGALGFYILPEFYTILPVEVPGFIDNAVVSIILFAIIFYFIGMAMEDKILGYVSQLEKYIGSLSSSYIIFAAIGVAVGLVLAWLFNLSLVGLQIPFVSNILPIVVTIILVYVGFLVGTSRREELRALFSGKTKETPKEVEDGEVQEAPIENFNQYKVLDTSVIIDGRIKDIVETGFLEGTLVVSSYVLRELQHIADSSDSLKRERGRRGLDILNALQNDNNLPVEIYDAEIDEADEVDQKLVVLAKRLEGVLVTNDYNLNKVAEFQNIPVLNINDLANSVKPIVIAGEQMTVTVVKEGSERSQGVAYLNDGTMIVVEDGKHYMNETIEVTVTSTLQTSAGKMIFSHPSHSDYKINRENS